MKRRLLTIHFNNFWALLSRPCASPVVWRRKKSVPLAKQGQSHRHHRQLHLMAMKFALDNTWLILPRTADVRFRRCQVFSDACTRRD